MVQPEFNLPGFILRELRLTDNLALSSLRSLDQVNLFIERPKTCNPEEATAAIEKMLSARSRNELFYWAIDFKGILVGTTCLFKFNEDRSRAELGYELHPDYHGKGWMRMAVKQVLEFGFTQLKLSAIHAFVHPGNIPSLRLLEHFHFSVLNQPDGSDFLVFQLNPKV